MEMEKGRVGMYTSGMGILLINHNLLSRLCFSFLLQYLNCLAVGNGRFLALVLFFILAMKQSD